MISEQHVLLMMIVFFMCYDNRIELERLDSMGGAL